MPQPEDDSAAVWLDVVELISLCGRRLKATMSRALTEEGLGDAQFSLLLRCSTATAAGVSQKKLADMLSVSPAHVSATLEQLRCLGLLCSRRCRDDRRRQLWVVTTTGQDVIQRITCRLQPWASRLESELGKQACRDLQTHLQGLVNVSSDQGLEDQDKSDLARPATSSRGRAA